MKQNHHKKLNKKKKHEVFTSRYHRPLFMNQFFMETMRIKRKQQKGVARESKHGKKKEIENLHCFMSNVDKNIYIMI